MKILACLLMLCCFTAVSSAGDSTEMLRQRLIFCDQFLIEHPHPAVLRDLTGFVDSTGGVGNRVHDCNLDAQHRDYR
jgi:hypothetical protein